MFHKTITQKNLERERDRERERERERMELDQTRPENPAMTFDEVSMERSKSFIKALQELKNLRPQMYSAAEYCEKSYLHSEQKQIGYWTT
uniref:Uncharacterized protein n=1 Tax=Salix viminalis TaxID=40686 RepID=A0A6N2N2E0_SALVM